MERPDVLYHIICGAPPAAHAEELLAIAKRAGWVVCVVATPMAIRFVDVRRLAALAGRPVRYDFKQPGEEDLFPRPSALAVAPATFNTVNKLVAGIADTLALALLCEYLAMSVPIVVAPTVNPTLAAHPKYRRSIAELRDWGVRVIDQQTSKPPVSSTGWMQPWERVLEALPAPGRPERREQLPVGGNEDA